MEQPTYQPLCPHCAAPTMFSQHQMAVMSRPVVAARVSNGGVLTIGSGFTESRVGEPMYVTSCCTRLVTKEQIITAYNGVEYVPFKGTD